MIYLTLTLTKLYFNKSYVYLNIPKTNFSKQILKYVTPGLLTVRVNFFLNKKIKDKTERCKIRFLFNVEFFSN
jgi:hypothetical protein